MSAYGILAGRYDTLTADVEYDGLAAYCARMFVRAGRDVSRVLDLACGTGSLTWRLAAMGYETIGVDASPEMLAVATGKSGAGTPPLFLCQPMERLDLYGDVDACVCCMDSVNYVTRPSALRRAFRRVHTFLAPGGLFLFDARTPEALAEMDGQVFTDETEDMLCLWRGAYSARRRVCTFSVDLFCREGDVWRRGSEEHRQAAHTPEELETFLREAGFAKITRHGNRVLRAPKAEDGRIFFAARKGD